MLQITARLLSQVFWCSLKNLWMLYTCCSALSSNHFSTKKNNWGRGGSIAGKVKVPFETNSVDISVIYRTQHVLYQTAVTINIRLISGILRDQKLRSKKTHIEPTSMNRVLLLPFAEENNENFLIKTLSGISYDYCCASICARIVLLHFSKLAS